MTSVPMKFMATWLFVAPTPVMLMPAPRLPEITLESWKPESTVAWKTCAPPFTPSPKPVKALPETEVVIVAAAPG